MSHGRSTSVLTSITDDAMWEQWMQYDGLLVVDVYSGWLGPCAVMMHAFRQMTVEISNERITYASADADKLEALEAYRDRSEPTYLFIKFGVLFKVIRGPRLTDIRGLIERYQPLDGDDDVVPEPWQPRRAVTLSRGYSGDLHSAMVYNSSGDLVFPCGSSVVVRSGVSNEYITFKKHKDEVSCLALHPRRDLVASGQFGDYPTLHVWSSSSGELVSSVNGGHLTRTCVAASFSPNPGKLLGVLSADSKHTICVFDWETNTEVVSAPGHPDKAVNALEFAPWSDGDVYKLVSCGESHIRFWECKPKSKVLKFKEGAFATTGLGRKQPLLCIGFGGDSVVYTGTVSGAVYAWREGALIKVITEVHAGPINSFAISPDRDSVVSCGEDGSLVFWRQETGVQPVPEKPASASRSSMKGMRSMRSMRSLTGSKGSVMGSRVRGLASAAAVAPTKKVDTNAPDPERPWDGMYDYDGAQLRLATNESELTGEWFADGIAWRLEGRVSDDHPLDVAAAVAFELDPNPEAEEEPAREPCLIRLEGDRSISILWIAEDSFSFLDDYDNVMAIMDENECDKLARQVNMEDVPLTEAEIEEQEAKKAAEKQKSKKGVPLWAKQYTLSLNTHLHRDVVLPRSVAWDYSRTKNLCVGLHTGEVIEHSDAEHDFVCIFHGHESSPEEAAAEESAAVRIQSLFRGHQTRMSLERQRYYNPDLPWQGEWLFADGMRIMQNNEGIEGWWREGDKMVHFRGPFAQGKGRKQANCLWFDGSEAVNNAVSFGIEDENTINLNWDEVYMFPDGTSPTSITRAEEPEPLPTQASARSNNSVRSSNKGDTTSEKGDGAVAVPAVSAEDPRADEAATRIQAVYRGHHVRASGTTAELASRARGGASADATASGGTSSPTRPGSRSSRGSRPTSGRSGASRSSARSRGSSRPTSGSARPASGASRGSRPTSGGSRRSRPASNTSAASNNNAGDNSPESGGRRSQSGSRSQSRSRPASGQSDASAGGRASAGVRVEASADVEAGGNGSKSVSRSSSRSSVARR